MDDLEAIERFMADLVQREAPQEVANFVNEISQNGVTQQEVDEVRQQAIMALQEPSTFPSFIRYLVASNLIEQKDAPKEFDVGFVLTILGLVGVAQQIVTTG